jgi:hypothetical protein
MYENHGVGKTGKHRLLQSRKLHLACSTSKHSSCCMPPAAHQAALLMACQVRGA